MSDVRAARRGERDALFARLGAAGQLARLSAGIVSDIGLRALAGAPLVELSVACGDAPRVGGLAALAATPTFARANAQRS